MGAEGCSQTELQSAKGLSAHSDQSTNLIRTHVSEDLRGSEVNGSALDFPNRVDSHIHFRRGSVSDGGCLISHSLSIDQ
jgi:hypothetical protein